MKERPVLFLAPMVRAILEGRKTQTRRVVKLPHANPLGQWEPTTIGGGGIYTARGEKVPHQGAIWHTRTGDVLGCPYGAPGDRLWVREAFGYEFDSPLGTNAPPSRMIYRADANHADKVGWAPSIHMPRWASRITLEITDVSVQRVQDISEEDVRAEGIHRIDHGREGSYYHAERTESHPNNWRDPCDAFRELWDSINEKRGFGWNVNPWVWVLTFKRVEQPA